MKALVTDATGLVGAPLAGILQEFGWSVGGLATASDDGPEAAAVDLSAWPDDPDLLSERLADVDVLFLPDLASPAWAEYTAAEQEEAIARLSALITAAGERRVARIVLLSSAEAYGATALEIGDVRETALFPVPHEAAPALAGAAAELEATLRQACSPLVPVVLRSLEVLGARAALPLQAVRAIIDGTEPDWPRERMHGIAAADVAQAMALAARSPAAAGEVFNLAGPEALAREAVLSEIPRLLAVLTQPEHTQVYARPSYPKIRPVLDTVKAEQVLHFRPKTPLWACLAESVQAVVHQHRAAGRLPPIDPQMPAAVLALERRTKPLEGKVAVVTGATAGIGRAASLMLSRLGARVVGVGRNATAGAALVEEIGRRSDAVPGDFLQADLSEMHEVRRVAAKLCSEFPRIDILLNNAGAVLTHREVTSEEIERTLAINLLSPLLLTRLLAEPIMAAGSARIVNVSSEAHRNAPVDLGDLQSEFDYRPLGAYGKAKSGLIMMTYALSEVMDGSGIRINAISPGAVRTGIWTAFDPANPTAVRPQERQRQQGRREQIRMQLISPEQAATYLVNLAMAPELEGVQGAYLDRDSLVPSAPHTLDRDVALRLWLACSELIGVEP